nr:unnamed protein product [Spirometra erinaceieuropaei]
MAAARTNPTDRQNRHIGVRWPDLAGEGTDGHLLNSRRMQASTCLSTTTIYDLLFADDCTLNTGTEVDIQRSTDLFAAKCARFGLTITTDKTVAMHQSSPNDAHGAHRIRLNGTQLRTVDNFECLGNILSRCIRIDNEVANQTSKTIQAFDRLQNCVRNPRGLHLNIKLKT